MVPNIKNKNFLACVGEAKILKPTALPQAVDTQNIIFFTSSSSSHVVNFFIKII
jgi:hypothetical protein